ncbi:alcohol dehydrogenase catalytic domain-containing protein, partial [Actinomadura adrarensis]
GPGGRGLRGPAPPRPRLLISPPPSPCSGRCQAILHGHGPEEKEIAGTLLWGVAMKAVVWRGVGDIALENVPEPRIEDGADAIVRITASAICGTDLHFVRGTMPGMRPGTILGHEAVGIIEELGPQVRNFNVGDRVVIPSTIGCGHCVYCRAGYFAQCDVANPNGPNAGTSFYGGPEQTGPFDGLQAEYARVPYAHTNLVPIPPGVTDEQALMVSDIFPTAW